ncbi:MAG: hypothetical protein SH868_12555 [Bythopirellula sp.]|nr:hypothetical protein [Bythopirellula sp.]
MLIDRSHRLWMVFTAAMAVGATGLYVWYANTWQGGPAGRTWPGMAFGVAGTLLMVIAGMLSARKKTLRIRFGSLSGWLKGHIWLGLLSVPLIFFHTAFRWGGLLEQILMAVFLIVIVSGILGVILQNILPRLMKSQLDSEVVPDQMDHLCRGLQREADACVVASCGGAAVEQALAREPQALSASTADPTNWLLGFYLESVRPYLGAAIVPGAVLASNRQGELVFERARSSVPDRLRNTLDQLEELCRVRRRLQLQAQLHGLLHGWLKVHIPLSVMLLVFTVLHIVTALYY